MDHSLDALIKIRQVQFLVRCVGVIIGQAKANQDYGYAIHIAQYIDHVAQDG